MAIIYYPQGSKVEERNTASGSQVVMTLAVPPLNSVFYFDTSQSLASSSLNMGGINDMIYFSASTTWTVPNNVSKIRAICIGGGGGTRFGNAGNAGGYAEGIFTVTAGSTIPVVVGVGTTNLGSPSDASTSSFLSLGATGGGYRSQPGVAPASGSGGTINLQGTLGELAGDTRALGGKIYLTFGTGADNDELTAGKSGAVIVYW